MDDYPFAQWRNEIETVDITFPKFDMLMDETYSYGQNYLLITTYIITSTQNLSVVNLEKNLKNQIILLLNMI